MNKDKYIWEVDRFRKDPYKVPEGYFDNFPDRMMERINQSGAVVHPGRISMNRSWIVWASGIAAVMVIGWFGFRNYYWKPLQEERFQENIALFVDFYGEELHEGQLAGYFEDNKIDLAKQATSDWSELVQIDPDLAEEYIYESVGK
jgi:hypothetical protein